MSTMQERISAVKEALKAIHRGESPDALKEKLKDVLQQISPHEIPLVEQELVREGVPVREILKLCDVHLALFRDYLVGRELRGVPEGHPLDILMKENQEILKLSEELQLYSLLLRGGPGERRQAVQGLKELAPKLRAIRSHYMKVQMLLFPYLERRGITAVPRVMWGREDEALLKARALAEAAQGLGEDCGEKCAELAEAASQLSKELADLVFRESKILFPTLWALLSEGEWAAVKEGVRELGELAEAGGWEPSAPPVLPHEVEGGLTLEQAAKLPPEVKALAASGRLEPDRYDVEKPSRLKLATGFLSLEELEGILRSLPVEVTFADAEGRVVFYSKSWLLEGFPRARTVLGRRLEFCHPPRLEQFIKELFESMKRGESDYYEFWTKRGGRLLRVLLVAVRGQGGEFLGAVEVAEDLTDVVERAGEIPKKVLVL